MGGDGVEQTRCDAIRIAIKESHPVQIFHLREAFEKHCEAVGAGPNLRRRKWCPGQSANFAHACCGEIFRFAHDGLEPAAAEFSAKLRITQNVQGWSQPSLILMYAVWRGVARMRGVRS